LLADQPILILDEPTEGLDRPTAMALVADLLDTAADRAVLMLTHRDEGLDLVDRRYCLVDGRLIASRDGTPLPGYPGLAAPSGLAEVIQPG
jgi:ATP-binding cassette subfamily C protein CydCD